ncbi:MAG: hypothetical protein CMM63_03700 [Rhodospirillaceae bacterium]|nr:hypothetical protein [Rhodospirillaceae bacterium]
MAPIKARSEDAATMCAHTGPEIDMTSDPKRLVETQRRNKSASNLRLREMRNCGASLATNDLARRIETKKCSKK